MLTVVFEAFGKERQHARPGVGGRGRVVVCALVVEEGVPGARIDLEIVRDTGGRELPLQRCSGVGRFVVLLFGLHAVELFLA